VSVRTVQVAGATRSSLPVVWAGLKAARRHQHGGVLYGIVGLP